MTTSDVIFYYTTVSVSANASFSMKALSCSLSFEPIECYFGVLLSSFLQTGWMMWNWLVSALAVGATVVLYDGSPFVPSPNVLWDCVDKLG